MPVRKEIVDLSCFNQELELPYSLRLKDFEVAMQDVYDFLFDVNTHLTILRAVEEDLKRVMPLSSPSG